MTGRRGVDGRRCKHICRFPPVSGKHASTGRSTVGAALAATGPLPVRRLRFRLPSGSEDPSHRTLARASADGRAPSLWERPWPRRGHCGPPASLQAAVGVRRPLPQNPARTPAAGRAPSTVGAALAATGPLRSGGFASGRCRGQKTLPRNPCPGGDSGNPTYRQAASVD